MYILQIHIIHLLTFTSIKEKIAEKRFELPWCECLARNENQIRYGSSVDGSPDDCRLRNDSAALKHTNWDEWEHPRVIISYFNNLRFHHIFCAVEHTYVI